MRIVGGRNRGRRLIAPKGAATRPTSDRIREAIFNILIHGLHLQLDGCPVLDLFAGTGALGFEALSRGAASVQFIENSNAAIDLIRANADALGEDAVTVVRADVRRLGAAPASDDSAGLAFLDPPYGAGLIPAALEVLAGPNWLADGAILVIETGRDEILAPPGAFELVEARNYGATKISFARYRA